ncbi:hypothetical protein ACJW31_12G088500 [Castanea mollissima]
MKRQQLVTLHYYSHSPQGHNTGGWQHIHQLCHTPILHRQVILHFIPSQVSCPKVASGYSFIETNLGKHNLTKLTNNQATQILKHPQWDPIYIEVQDNLSFIIIFSYGPKSNLLSSMLLLFLTPMPTQYQAWSCYKLIYMPCNYQNKWGVNFDVKFGFNYSNDST